MTNEQEVVQSRLLSRMADAGIDTMGAASWCALVLAAIDTTVGAIRWGWPGVAVFIESLVWSVVIFFAASAIILAPLLALLVVFGETPISFARKWSLRILGPSGKAYYLIPVEFVGGVFLGGAGDQFAPIPEALQDGTKILIRIGFFVIGVLGTLIASRLLAKRIPAIRKPTSLTLLAGALFGILISGVWGQFLGPHRLIVALIPILVILFGAVATVDTPFIGRVGKRLSVILAVGVLVWVALYGSRPVAHAFLMERTNLTYPAIQTIWFASDFDGDGFSSLPMGGDCAPFDTAINLTAFEMVNNGIDENCTGGDLPSAPPYRAAAPKLTLKHTQKLPDVYVIMIDSLRADHVGGEGPGLSFSPVMDAFGLASTRFTRAYTPSNHTDEALPATFTSNFPAAYHQNNFFYGLDPNLPEVLGDVGYWSIGVTCLPWAKNFTVSGFETLDNRCGEERPKAEANVPADSLQASRAAEWIAKRPDGKPIFMLLHLFDPHAPYLFNPNLQEALGPESYAHEVFSADLAVGEFLEALAQENLLERSVVIIYADHGEGLADHWSWTHGRTAYEEVARVPLFMRFPGIKPNEVSVPVSSGQIFSTVIDYLGIQGVSSRAMPSLMPSILGTPQALPLFLEGNYGSVPSVRAIVDGEYKLVFDYDKRHYLMFNVINDPHERTNLVGAEPAQFLRMKRALWRWWDEQFNDVLLKRKAAEWEGDGVRMPKTIMGDVGFVRETQQKLIQ